MDSQRVKDCFELQIWAPPSKNGPESHTADTQQGIDLVLARELGNDHFELEGYIPSNKSGQVRQAVVTAPDAHFVSCFDVQVAPASNLSEVLEDDASTKNKQASCRAVEVLISDLDRAPKRLRVNHALIGTSALDILSAGSNLLAELKRLVPVGMLAIEDADENGGRTSFLERQDAAREEVDRILQANLQGHAILVGDSAECRRVACRQIVVLLHPDLVFVPGDDPRGIKALYLSLKAFVQSEVACVSKTYYRSSRNNDFHFN